MQKESVDDSDRVDDAVDPRVQVRHRCRSVTIRDIDISSTKRSRLCYLCAKYIRKHHLDLHMLERTMLESTKCFA